MTGIVQAIRAGSISPQATAGTAAATLNMLSRASKVKIRTVQTWDTPDVLAFQQAMQIEDYPATRMAVAEITMQVDNQDTGLLMCGLAGRPTAGVWLIGGSLSPDLLTITKWNGLTTVRQLIDGIVTSWGLAVTPMSNGRAVIQAKVMGLRTAPVSAPSLTPPFTAGKSIRANNFVIKRNTVATRMLAFNASFDRATTPDFATPLAATGSGFAEPDEIESPGITGKADCLYKYLAYTGSAIETSESATTEAWELNGSRPDLSGTPGVKLELPNVQWEDPDEDDDNPRTKQAPKGKILYAPSIAALARFTLTGSSLDYALS